MKIEEKFNKRTAELIEVQSPLIDVSRGLALGIKVEFFTAHSTAHGNPDYRTLSMHLTPEEATAFAYNLIGAAIQARRT